MQKKYLETSIWEDEWFASLSCDTQRLFIYFITNKENSYTGIYKIATRKILYDLSLTSEEFWNIYQKISEKIFYDGYQVIIKNHIKYSKISHDDNNFKSLVKEISSINPKTFLEADKKGFFDSLKQYPHICEVLEGASEGLGRAAKPQSATVSSSVTSLGKGGVGGKEIKYKKELDALVKVWNHARHTTLKSLDMKCDDYAVYRKTYDIDDIVYAITKREFLGDDFSWIGVNNFFNCKSKTGNSLDMVAMIKDADIVNGSATDFQSSLAEARRILQSNLEASKSE